METTNKELEQENLEQNRSEEQENSVSISKDEYDKLLQDSKDYKASTKEAQKLHWIAKIAVDNTKFLKLYKTDKVLAQAVAKHFSRDAEELYESIKEEGKPEEGLDMEDISKRAEAIANKTVAKQTLESFKKELKISGKLEKSFDEEFDNLMGDKDWSPEEVKKQAKRALKLIKDTDEFQQGLESSKQQLAGAGVSGGTRATGAGEKTPYQRYKEQKANGSLLSKYGVSKDF